VRLSILTIERVAPFFWVALGLRETDAFSAVGDRQSAPGVSQLTASGSLIGAGASAIFQWRQGAVRRDFDTRQSVCADAADSWGARRLPRAERRTDTQGRWLCALKHRKGTHVAAVALANKNARVIWALLAHDEAYRQPV
jgi:hypothetical protein